MDDGGFIACGSSLGQNVESFPQQAWLVRMNDQGEIVHTYDIEKFFPRNPLTVYPNPASDVLNIDVEEEAVENVKVYSADGTLLFMQDDTTQVNVNRLKSGTYYVVVNDRYVKGFVVD